MIGGGLFSALPTKLVVAGGLFSALPTNSVVHHSVLRECFKIVTDVVL